MAMRFPFRRRRRHNPGASAPETLLLDLAGARPEGDYSEADRRSDFRAVLLGSEAGRRVLYEMLAWTRVFASTFVPGDSCATHWREGGRDIGLRVLAVLAPETETQSLASGKSDGEGEPHA